MAGAAIRGALATAWFVVRLRPRLLGARLVLTLTAIGLAGAVAITLLLAAIITPSFSALEAQSIEREVERTRAVLDDYAGKVESAVRDYGDWDASYNYMRRPNTAFERESFSPPAMANLGVNGMAYVRDARRIVIARWIDADGRDNPAMRRHLVAAIKRSDPASVLSGQRSNAYYLRLGDRVAAVAVARVRRSDGTGAPLGFVLMAKEITSARLSALLGTHAQIDTAASQRERVERTPSRIALSVPIDGPNAVPVASARFAFGRDVFVLGRRVLLLAVAGSTLLLLLILVVLRRTVDRQVLAPLGRVERHMQHVRASGSLGLLDEEDRSDEIGSLGRSFNAMLRQLEDLREQIEAQSFALGRTESAVAVMHNVRNALNPVSTILSHGIRQAPPVDRAMLDRALDELAGGDVGEDRREKLAAFVRRGIDATDAARAEQVRQLGIGREALAHVLDIIGTQQAQAHERPALSDVDVTEVVAQNATIARYSDACSVALSFPAQPMRAMANRVLLSQVIGNLFSNAAEAIAATGRNSGSIAVTVHREGAGVVIRIRDDGEGFRPEEAPHFFQRGFSTRAHKSGGLGLHWCANSMVAMEGSLVLVSEGPGRGAVAVLTLRAPEAMAAAA
ncbi:CHASE4 domain-containing protein [Sphingomonas sp.]|uniref:CHASE4 domain-containing protein n=1 Tax=Sphingomonas sp. TaxID=28214 RepID=UPI0035C7A40D